MQKHSVPFLPVTLQHQAGQCHQLLPKRMRKGWVCIAWRGCDSTAGFAFPGGRAAPAKHLCYAPSPPSSPNHLLRLHIRCPSTRCRGSFQREGKHPVQTQSTQEGCSQYIWVRTSDLSVLGVLSQGAGFYCCCSLRR